jgi:glyoxylase-like metal-dependent hydrolase (beta-lactamase superfamily II)
VTLTFFKQIKHQGDNFSYIIADETSAEAAVVDPSYNTDPIIRMVRRHNLTVKYAINTHQHSDHTTGNQEIKMGCGAKIVAHKLAKTEKDISVIEGDILKLSSTTVKIIHTPGHSPDSICLLTDNKLLTGDTLFVGECGRTDLPGGSSKDMYYSLFDKLMKLDGDIEVYPGHDYGTAPHSTIEAERKTNYTLEKRTLDEFIEFMRQP